jgi:hypothetical protein
LKFGALSPGLRLGIRHPLESVVGLKANSQ